MTEALPPPLRFFELLRELRSHDVEFIVVDDRMRGKKLHEGGRLADVAPTALHMMGLAKPGEMNGRSLIPE